MEPLSILAVLGSVQAFVELGVKVARILKDYSDKAEEIPRSFQIINVQLPLLIDVLTRLDGERDVKAMSQSAREALVRVVTDCKGLCTKIESLIERTVRRNSENSPYNLARKAIWQLKDEEKVKSLETSLHSYIALITLHVTVKRDVDVAAPQLSYFEVPLRRRADLIPREGLVSELDMILKPAALTQSTKPVVAILQGPRFAGKTQLALEYSFKSHEDGLFKSVFWIDASTTESVRHRFEGIAIALRQSKVGLKELDDKIMFVKDFLSSWWHCWLLVFDNCSQTFLENELQGFLPSEAYGTVICTTSSDNIDDSRCHTIQVNPFQTQAERKELEFRFRKAVFNNDFETVVRLLDQGVDVDCRENDFLPPGLYKALVSGNEPMAQLLLQSGANAFLGQDASDALYTGLYHALDQKHYKIAALVLQYEKLQRPDPKTHRHDSILQSLANTGNEEGVQFLLEHAPATLDLNQVRRTGNALRSAVERGHHSIVFCLLDAGATIEAASRLNDSLIYEAVQRGHTDIIQTLCDHGADPNSPGRGGQLPLTCAISNSNAGIIDILLSAKAGINMCPSNPAVSYPLHAAVNTGNEPIVARLLELGADPNAPNDDGLSPLSLAIKNWYGRHRGAAIETSRHPSRPHDRRRENKSIHRRGQARKDHFIPPPRARCQLQLVRHYRHRATPPRCDRTRRSHSTHAPTPQCQCRSA